jgi:hypothetical protein
MRWPFVLLIVTGTLALSFFLTFVVYLVHRWRRGHPGTTATTPVPQRRVRYLVRSEDATDEDVLKRSWTQHLGPQDDYEFVLMNSETPWLPQTIQVLRDNLKDPWDVVVLTNPRMYFQTDKLQRWLHHKYPQGAPVRDLLAPTRACRETSCHG